MATTRGGLVQGKESCLGLVCLKLLREEQLVLFGGQVQQEVSNLECKAPLIYYTVFTAVLYIFFYETINGLRESKG